VSRQAKQFHREFTYTESDFEAVRDILYATAGISLEDGKCDLVYGRLARRLRAYRLGSFSAYLKLLDSAQGEQEMVHFINALTTNLTGFFREPHHFDYLARNVLPEAAERLAVDHGYRIWSAGCSTGEEAYSIAMVVRESMQCHDNLNASILATDLDSSVVAKAMQGLYSSERIAGLSQARVRTWFRRIDGAGQHDVQVDSALRELIEFRQFNLVDDWPVNGPASGPFDIIFCRNVMIYFDRQTQHMLFDRFADCLADGGYLFVGRSETVHTASGRFEPAGRSMFRKL